MDPTRTRLPGGERTLKIEPQMLGEVAGYPCKELNGCEEGEIVNLAAQSMASLNSMREKGGGAPLSASNMGPLVLRVQEAIGCLAQQLHSALGREEGNLCFSPLSIFPVLCMVVEAAGDEAREKFLCSLGLREFGLDNVRTALKVIFSSFSSEESKKFFTIDAANGMAVAEGVQQDFVERMREGYDAEIFGCSDNPQGACSDVNNWVSRKTNQKIPKLLNEGDMPPKTAAVLLNAIYFLGTWQFPFAGSLTSPRPFYFPDGKMEHVTAMHYEESPYLNYCNTGELEMLEVPFEGPSYPKELRTLLFLPKKGDPEGLFAIEKQLNLSFIDKLLKSSAQKEIALQFPKLDMDKKVNDLIGSLLDGEGAHPIAGIASLMALKEMGERIKLFKIVHQAKIKFDEKGAEGAAATAAICCEESFRWSNPLSVVVDRPFAYAVMHGNTILFQGSVKERSAFEIGESKEGDKGSFFGRLLGLY